MRVFSPPSKRRILWFLVLLLSPLLAIGSWIAFLLMIPQSQPAFFLPPDANPPPAVLQGRPSGRMGPLDLVLAGDAMLGRGVDGQMARDPAFRPLGGLAWILGGADLVAFNLETTITDRGSPWWGKTYRYRMDPKHRSAALDQVPGAVRFASVANNHVLDFGVQGLQDTLGALDDAGFLHAGAGATAEAAWAPVIVETRGGVRVGLLALTDHCGCLNMSSWVATAGQPGVAWADLSRGELEPVLAHVRALDAAVDVVVVALHWGPNWLPDGRSVWMEQTARALVDAGADVLFGTSSHHVLPVDLISGKHVFYGLGPLVDDYGHDPAFRSDLGAVAKLHIDAEGAQTVELVPVRIKGRAVRALQAGSADFEAVLHMAEGGVAGDR